MKQCIGKNGAEYSADLVHIWPLQQSCTLYVALGATGLRAAFVGMSAYKYGWLISEPGTAVYSCV